jgi:hypothetical protein
MAVIVGSDLGKSLCDALGIDPKGVTGIDIRIRPHEAVTVTVHKYMSQVEASACLQALADGKPQITEQQG